MNKWNNKILNKITKIYFLKTKKKFIFTSSNKFSFHPSSVIDYPSFRSFLGVHNPVVIFMTIFEYRKFKYMCRLYFYQKFSQCIHTYICVCVSTYAHFVCIYCDELREMILPCPRYSCYSSVENQRFMIKGAFLGSTGLFTVKVQPRTWHFLFGPSRIRSSNPSWVVIFMVFLCPRWSFSRGDPWDRFSLCYSRGLITIVTLYWTIIWFLDLRYNCIYLFMYPSLPFREECLMIDYLRHPRFFCSWWGTVGSVSID